MIYSDVSIEYHDCVLAINIMTPILQSLSFYRFLEGFKIYLRDDLITSDRLCVSNRETIVMPTALFRRVPYYVTLYRCIVHISSHNQNKCNFL